MKRPPRRRKRDVRLITCWEVCFLFVRPIFLWTLAKKKPWFGATFIEANRVLPSAVHTGLAAGAGAARRAARGGCHVPSVTVQELRTQRGFDPEDPRVVITAPWKRQTGRSVPCKACVVCAFFQMVQVHLHKSCIWICVKSRAPAPEPVSLPEAFAGLPKVTNARRRGSGRFGRHGISSWRC